MRPSPAVLSPWMTPNREPNDQLRPLVVRGSGGGTGVYDEIEAGHPKVADAFARLATALATMEVEWVLDDPDARERMIIDDLTSLWNGMGADWDNDIGGPGSVLGQAVTYWSRGNCTFALRWVDSQSSGRRLSSFDGLDIEAYPVHPSSILRWKTDLGGRLEGIVQSTFRATVDLERSDLITCARMAVPGQFEGTSMARPLVFLFERWKSIWLSAERSSWMSAGLVTLNEPAGVGEQDRARANQALEQWMNGEAPFLVLPDGWTVQFDAPSGSDMMGQIEKIDAYVDTTLGNQVAALSYAAHATRSLGEVLSAEQSRDASREIETFLGLFGSQFAAWVCRQIGYDGRMPRLQIVAGQVDENPADTIGTLSTALGAGLIRWTPEDEEQVRETLGLRTALEEAGTDTTVELADEAPPASAPASAQRASAAALMHRRSASEKWQGTPQEIMLAKSIAGGDPISKLEMRMLEAYFAEVGDPTMEPGWADRGPVWQKFNAYGGEPMATYLGQTLADEDGVPVEMSDGCGCGSCVTMADRKGVEVIGADGRPFTAPAALEGVELFVTWADNDDERKALDRAVGDQLAAVAERHRRATWSALRDGWQPGEAQAVLEKFLPQYRAALETYGRDVAMMVSRWTAEEAIRQGEADGTPRRRGMEASVALFNQVRDAADARMSRAAAGLMMAAEETARRVQSDVERAWRAGIPRRSFTPVFTDLVSPARPSAQLIESEGRVAAAADMTVEGEAAELGLEPARVVRTSVMDRRRCGHCAELSQTTFNLPEELAQWEAMPLPDPQCLGGAERCRCGWLVEWRR